MGSVRPTSSESDESKNRGILDRLLARLSVQVEEFALCTLSPGWRMSLPSSTEVFVKFVLEGQGVIRETSGKTHSIGPGHLIVVPKGVKYQVETGNAIIHELTIAESPEGSPPFRVSAGKRDEASLVIACGILQAKYGRVIDVFQHLPELLVVDFSGLDTARLAFREILEEQTADRPGRATVTSALMTQCLTYLFRHLVQEQDDAPPWLSGLFEPRLARTLELILSNPGAPHTITSLAQGAAMSRSSFSERFRLAFGHSPMSFVTHCRMLLAAELLDGGMRVSEVAEQIGFASRNHFATAFRKHVGVSPSAYHPQ